MHRGCSQRSAHIDVPRRAVRHLLLDDRGHDSGGGFPQLRRNGSQHVQSSQGSVSEGRQCGRCPVANIDPNGIVIVEGKATDVLADDAASLVQGEGEF